MSDQAVNAKSGAEWKPWMHVAGVAYPLALLVLVVATVIPEQILQPTLVVGILLLTVATFTFIAGIGRLIASR